VWQRHSSVTCRLIDVRQPETRTAQVASDHTDTHDNDRFGSLTIWGAEPLDGSTPEYGKSEAPHARRMQGVTFAFNLPAEGTPPYRRMGTGGAAMSSEGAFLI
jgi:hypothetical protein